MSAPTDNAEHVARRHRDVLNRCDAPDGLRVPYQTSLDTEDRAALERLMAERLVEAARPAGIEHARFAVTDAGRAMRLRMDADDASTGRADAMTPDPRHDEDPERTTARQRWAAESEDTARRAAQAATIRDLDALADQIAAAGESVMCPPPEARLTRDRQNQLMAERIAAASPRPAPTLALRDRSGNVHELGVPWPASDPLPEGRNLPDKWSFRASDERGAVDLIGASGGAIRHIPSRELARHVEWGPVDAHVTLPDGWTWWRVPDPGGIAAAGDAAMRDAMATGLGAQAISADSAGGVSARYIQPGDWRAHWEAADRLTPDDMRSAGVWPPADVPEPEPDEDTSEREYDDLRRQIEAAFAQAATGKGRERHADGRRWTDQPIFTVARQHGAGFLTGQAAKKLGEAAAMSRRGEHNRARHEMLGAIVYAAAAAHMAEHESDEGSGEQTNA